jgi:hypothetical protein
MSVHLNRDLELDLATEEWCRQSVRCDRIYLSLSYRIGVAPTKERIVLPPHNHRYG